MIIQSINLIFFCLTKPGLRPITDVRTEIKLNRTVNKVSSVTNLWEKINTKRIAKSAVLPCHSSLLCLFFSLNGMTS